MEHAKTTAGEPMVVLTAAEYEALRAASEDRGDIALARAARAADAGAPSLSADLSRAVLSGQMHPLAAWRKAANLSALALGEMAGIRPATISDIEQRKIDPRLSTVKALAEALGVGIDDIAE